MPDVAYITIEDYSGEPTRMKMNTVDLTAANLAAQQAALATLVAATPPLVRGTIRDSNLQILTPGTAITPVSEEAQIEKGWLVLFVDDQPFLDPGTDLVPNPGFGKSFISTWPTAEYTGHLTAASDFADLANADVAAFVTAFEALYRSPYGGTITVQSIRVVGVDA